MGLMPEFAVSVRARSPGKTPALRSAAQAERLFETARLVTVRPVSSLPSLVEGATGNRILKTWWGLAQGPLIYAMENRLTDRKDALRCKLAEGADTFVQRSLWSALDAIVRGRALPLAERGALSPAAKSVWKRLAKGPVRYDHLREDLKFETPAQGRVLQAAKQELLGLGIVVAREDKEADTHTHASLLCRWGDWYPAPGGGGPSPESAEATLAGAARGAIALLVKRSEG